MMRSKMLNRAEARGREAGLNNAMKMVKFFIEGNDIAQIAEVLGEEEVVVRKSLVKAGLIQE